MFEKNSWNKDYYSIAHGDIERMQGDPHTRVIANHLRGLSSGGGVLEIGCGLAGFAHIVPDGVQYVGIDVSEYAIKRAQKVFAHREGVKLFVGSGETLHIPDESIDMVIMRNVLEMLSKPKETLAEVVRVLKQGGRVFIIAPNHESPFSSPNAIRHKSLFYRAILFFKRVGDYLQRLLGRFPFRTIEENVVQATGENVLPDDDLLYLVSSFEVIRFLESKGCTIIETERFTSSRNWRQKLKKLITKLPGCEYLGIELFVIAEKLHSVEK